MPGEYNSQRDHYHLYDADWDIVGGGHWVIDDTGRTLRLHGYSQAYGPYDPAGLLQRLKAVPALDSYRITLE